MKSKKSLKSMKIKTVIVFVVVFIIINSFAHVQIWNHKKEEQYKAAYTAEVTMRRIESQLNKYLARQSGEYTIAGPFELIQGGKGALLFDPIYLSDENGNQQFWGFSILVLDWSRFIEELGLVCESPVAWKQYAIYDRRCIDGSGILAVCAQALQGGDLCGGNRVVCEEGAGGKRGKNPFFIQYES